MCDIVHFLLEPYRNAAWVQILLEVIAAAFGVSSVVFAKRESIMVFPFGIISTAIYVYLLAQWTLYGDLIINIYYTAMSVYGWYMWSKISSENQAHISISKTTTKEKWFAIFIFLSTSIFVLIIYRYYDVISKELSIAESVRYVIVEIMSGELNRLREITPYLDTFTTGVFFAAMWLMARKKIENWQLWIWGNMVSIPLYLVKGYGFTSLHYLVFLILAIQGYRQWRKKLVL